MRRSLPRRIAAIRRWCLFHKHAGIISFWFYWFIEIERNHNLSKWYRKHSQVSCTPRLGAQNLEKKVFAINLNNLFCFTKEKLMFFSSKIILALRRWSLLLHVKPWNHQAYSWELRLPLLLLNKTRWSLWLRVSLRVMLSSVSPCLEPLMKYILVFWPDTYESMEGWEQKENLPFPEGSRFEYSYECSLDKKIRNWRRDHACVAFMYCVQSDVPVDKPHPWFKGFIFGKKCNWCIGFNYY